jgi:hypothetical protein
MLSSTDEAEETARIWLKGHYGNRIAKVTFHQVTLEQGAWRILADLTLRKGVLDTFHQDVSLTIDSMSGKVMGYKEGTPEV